MVPTTNRVSIIIDLNSPRLVPIEKDFRDILLDLR